MFEDENAAFTRLKHWNSVREAARRGRGIPASPGPVVSTMDIQNEAFDRLRDFNAVQKREDESSALDAMQDEVEMALMRMLAASTTWTNFTLDIERAAAVIVAMRQPR